MLRKVIGISIGTAFIGLVFVLSMAFGQTPSAHAASATPTKASSFQHVAQWPDEMNRGWDRGGRGFERFERFERFGGMRGPEFGRFRENMGDRGFERGRFERFERFERFGGMRGPEFGRFRENMGNRGFERMERFNRFGNVGFGRFGANLP